MRFSNVKVSVGIASLVAGQALSSFAGFVGQVINFDFNTVEVDVRRGGSDLFAGDNAIFSSSSGTTWNDVGAFSLSTVNNALDQFGVSTPVDLGVIQAGEFSGRTALNELQDSGLATPIGDIVVTAEGANGNGGPLVIGPNDIAFIVSGLLQAELYSLAVYVAGDPKSGTANVNVQHAGGVSTDSQNNFPSFMLPGDLTGDYLLFNGLAPYELLPGEYDFSSLRMDVLMRPTSGVSRWPAWCRNRGRSASSWWAPRACGGFADEHSGTGVSPVRLSKTQARRLCHIRPKVVSLLVCRADGDSLWVSPAAS